jgi:lysyl-tRNA synthetase class 2
MTVKNTWQPTASIDALRARAELNTKIRQYFFEKNVVEVETPLLGAAATLDPNIEPMQTSCSVFKHPLYLQTSPEYAMKRLLAAGSGSIYQLGKAFRDDDFGRRHNPEFTLLEWYRVGFTWRELVDDVAAIARLALGDLPISFISYGQLFEQHLDINPHRASADDLAQLANEYLDLAFDEADRDTWLNLLFVSVIEPLLGVDENGEHELCIVYDYPASQAALAQIVDDENGDAVALRFELFVNGMELANGYQELTDANQQRQRFEHEKNLRAEKNLTARDGDQRLIAALEYGLPACSGVALGIDRLLMLQLGVKTIAEVLAFSAANA